MSTLYPTSSVAGPSTAAAPPHTMSEILLAPLAELQTLTHTLFHALSPTQTRPPPVPPLGAFLDADAALAAAVRLARAHQGAHRANERRKAAFLALEEHWRAVVAELEHGRQELAGILTEGAERVRSVEAARAAAIPYPELLQYAHSLSAFTSAPPNMPALAPGQPPPPLFFPPFPNEEKMRRGHMNAEEPLGTVGEVRDVGKARTVSPHPIERPQHMGGPNPFRMDHREHQGVFDLDLDLNPDL
ncbi:Mediator of RNA polymerase II transcription subunit 4 [Phanerochaete sordida]|uniref:Mediator of RNA polymerase II transcription subunit 4 n=1 Tax=Phanerochaete sordida TaxID=48140 RepID=A0A9P3LKV9_9APHY|nr:Mediator of RNA polymerase II transcription subunit 4 [Phanerochaete sordida]